MFFAADVVVFTWAQPLPLSAKCYGFLSLHLGRLGSTALRLKISIAHAHPWCKGERFPEIHPKAAPGTVRATDKDATQGKKKKIGGVSLAAVRFQLKILRH